jgi:membrane protease YdiL (CAAX protease family)
VAQRRRPGTLSSVAGRLRWKWLAVCCGLALLFLAISFGWSYAVTAMFTHDRLEWPKWAGWQGFVAPAIVIVLLVPLQATAEEYLFRGWFVQAVGSWAPSRWTGWFGRMLALWPALLISATVFTLGHGYTGWARVDTFLFGLVVGLLAVRTGGLEAGIALHSFNNLYAFLLPAAAGQLRDALHQGGGDWQALLSDAVPLVLYAGAVLLVARKLKVKTATD